MNGGAHWRGWLAGLGVLLLGIALGAAGTAWGGVRAFRQAMQGERSFAERAVQRIGDDLTENLRLTPDESARVRAVLEDSATRLKAVRTQAAAQAIGELRSASQRIAAELPAEKRAEYRRLMIKRYERLGFPPPKLDP